VKPAKETLAIAYESWIPQLDLSSGNFRLRIDPTIDAIIRAASSGRRAAQ
jgi:hypothetical protein